MPRARRSAGMPCSCRRSHRPVALQTAIAPRYRDRILESFQCHPSLPYGDDSGDFGRSWKITSAPGCTVCPLHRLVRRVDPHGPTFKRLHQLRAGRSADLARTRAGLKKCSHRFPEIRDVLKKGLGVTISLVYQTLSIVAAEEPVVLQGPDVLGADRFHAL